MSYGFESYTQTNNLAASSDYPCLYQIASPTIVNEFDTTRNGMYMRSLQTNIPASQQPPLLFVQLSPGEQACLYAIEQQGITINGSIQSIWVYYIVGANRGAVGSGFSRFRWYTELPAGSGQASGDYGIVIRNSSGNIMFDSNRNPLWLGDVFAHSGPTTLVKGSWPYYGGLSMPLTQPTPANAGAPYSNLLISGTVAGFFLLGGSGTPFAMVPQYRSDGTAIDFTPWRAPGTDFSTGPASITVGQFLLMAADAPGQ